MNLNGPLPGLPLQFGYVVIEALAGLIRKVGVKLKAMPDHHYGVFGGKCSECLFKISLADVTKGTHEVTPDIDSHFCVHGMYTLGLKMQDSDG